MQAKATFGAGCFWGVEAAFRRVDGVIATEVGYAGGRTESPTYDEVCSHSTGHVEVVQVSYDPERVPYEALLATFWAEHDPTQRNRQGPDIGDQYRSVIFVHDGAQRKSAEGSRERVQQRLSKPVVTAIEDAPAFWPAEDYHQQFLEKRGLATCNLALAS